MTNTKDMPAPSDQLSPEVPTVRRCLKCDTTFTSSWSGERICLPCKRSNSWRNGVPPKSYSYAERI